MAVLRGTLVGVRANEGEIEIQSKTGERQIVPFPAIWLRGLPNTSIGMSVAVITHHQPNLTANETVSSSNETLSSRSDSNGLNSDSCGSTGESINSSGHSIGSHDDSIGTRFLVLEPEKLYDVTEIAECIYATGDEPMIGFIKRFEKRTNSVAMVRGIMLNSVFDVLVGLPELDDESVVENVVQSRPLALAALFKSEGESVINSIVQEIRESVSKYRSIITLFGADKISVEPQLISNVFGLQGRFDIVVQEPDGVRLIEMKSGKAPSLSYSEKGVIHRNSIRSNHAAQVCAYALLYDAIHPGQRKSAEVWYSTASEKPFRIVANEADYIQRILLVRNGIVLYERAMQMRNFGVLKIADTAQYNHTGYAAQFISTFSNAYNSAANIHRTIAQIWMSFVATARVSASELQASLWRSTIQEKRDQKQAITDLTVNADLSDFQQMHIQFERDAQIGSSSIRIGDHVVVHAITENGTSSPCANQILKGSVKSVRANRVLVSLRNKQFSHEELLHNKWIVEQDISDSGLKQLYASVFTFLQAPIARQNIIIGVDAPGKPVTPAHLYLEDPEITEHQKDIIERAVNCTDYFLIQGPPGTGKTQIILKNIVAQLVQNSAERILVLTYTNRAANEICDALETSTQFIDFLRHGSKYGASEGSADRSIPVLAHHLSTEALAARINSAHCIVGTVQSVLSSPEVWEFGDFTTLIIDEASQVLEPHLAGILPRVKRWILIGDECQLPAVVTQDPTALQINSEILHNLGYLNTAVSYFERMRALCKKNGWGHAIGTLIEQGRMHYEIMHVASTLAYNGKLKTVLPWQQDSTSAPWWSVIQSRAFFIPILSSEKDQQADEAAVIVNLILSLVQFLDFERIGSTLGVITPFRAQNNLISELLPVHLSDEITIDTVERFQGSQRDVIIFGTAVSNQTEFESIRSETTSGGQTVDRKLNVAITRAKKQFVLVGNSQILTTSSVYRRTIDLLSTKK
ncbi:MAG: ATP-dependent helicase [Ignavibacteria bacterium]|nr:ATP-dependent helicase [Ignavibacteria bacterium]